MNSKFLLALAMLFLIVACTTQPEPAPPEEPAKPVAEHVGDPERAVLDEAFVSASRPADNVDSIGIYHAGSEHWALVTAKEGHKLLVYNAMTGELVKEIGEPGSGEGQMQRPNGVQVVGDLAMVVERDNARVQVLRLPAGDTVGMIGLDILERPYGLSAYVDGEGVIQLYVTDDYELEEGAVAPADFYTKRVKHFAVRDVDGAVTAELVNTFGDADGEGRLFKVESIMADPKRARIFICDEQGETAGIKIYSLAGDYLGQRLKTDFFKGEPEGLAIWEGRRSYLVTTDQQPDVSVFHLYDMSAMEHVFAFQGKVTTNTDGIALSQTAMPGFPSGALWAIHDDQALSAFNWTDVEAAMAK